MQIQRLEMKDLSFYILLAVLYVVVYLPHVFREFPSDYRPAVQSYTSYVAETLAQGGNPYTPPYPPYYSSAGGHLQGVAGTPFVLIIDSPAAFRLGSFFMGFISLLLFYLILREIGVRRAYASATTVLLSIYPQFILFNTAGNPSAGDLFFGLIAVFAYLQWRSEDTFGWLVASSIASGAAVFSHFYAGVVAIGLLAHYTLTTSHKLRRRVRTAVVYGTGMIPAGGLLILYKIVFSGSDPNSHYFNRLIFNSFDSLYATERIDGTEFNIFSNRFILRLLNQHGDISPMFGRWWLVLLVSIVLALGWRATPTEKYDDIMLVLTWIASGSLTVLLIPGGAIYHEYYTWWLLVGVFAGIGWSFEMLLPPVSTDRNPIDVVVLIFPVLLTGLLLWFSFNSPWTTLIP